MNSEVLGAQYKSIFSPELTRFLLHSGEKLIDIKPDKRVDYSPISRILFEETESIKLSNIILTRILTETNLLDKTIFVFEISPTLFDNINKWKEQK